MLRDRFVSFAVIIYFLIWIIGVVLGYLFDIQITENAVNNRAVNDYFNLVFFHPLLNILFNNIIYGLCVLLMSLLSFGVIPLISFLHSGFIFGVIINYAVTQGIETQLIILNMIHSPIEVIAFCLIAVWSLKLLVQYKVFSRDEVIRKRHLKKLLPLFGMIIIAALVEYASITFTHA